MKINRNDIVELVLEHAINQGCYSQIYMDRLLQGFDARHQKMLMNVADAMGNGPIYLAGIRSQKKSCLQMLCWGAKWYNVNVNGHDLLDVVSRDFKLYLEKKFILGDKMRVFLEALLPRNKGRCMAHGLDVELMKLIFSFMF